MRRLWTAGAAMLMCLALDGVPAVAQSPEGEAGASPSAAITSGAPTPSAAGTAGGACVVSTFAGKAGEAGAVDGIGATARFSGEPQYIVMDSAGALYLTDTADHAIRKVTQDGVVTTFAGKLGEPGIADGVGSEARFTRPSGRAIAASDTLYVAGNEDDTVRRITPDGTVTTLAAELGIEPSGIALDAAGNVYTGGWVGNVILKITPDGTVTELAGTRGRAGWDDGTGAAARFGIPLTLVADANGTIFVIDVANDYYHSALRTVTPDGTVTTVRSSWDLGQPGVIWIDPSGTFYLTSYPDNTVTKLTRDGTETLLAGKPGAQGSADGPGDAARLAGPIGILRDASGLFYIVDSDNHTIRTMRCP
jgi:sugar lactone lactonase YvrE